MKKKKNNKKSVVNNTQHQFRENILSVSLTLLAVFLLVGMALGLYESTFKFWKKDNELRTIANFGVIKDINDEILDGDYKILEQVEGNLLEKTNFLKSGMYDFFKEEYRIDISSKLNKMSVCVFTDESTSKFGILNGFYDIELNTINLNSEIIHNDFELNTTFVHETIHYLGISEENPCSQFFIEGITDALTQQCLQYMGLKFNPTPFYEPQRMLAMQLLAVDKQMVVNAITQDDFDVMNRINEVLKDVPRTCLPCDNVAEYLGNATTNIYFETVYMGYSENTQVYFFMAQDIISSYCKEFNPTKKQISQIRKNYIIGDFENMVVEETETGYIVYSR